MAVVSLNDNKLPSSCRPGPSYAGSISRLLPVVKASLKQGQPGFNTTAQSIRSERGSTSPGGIPMLRNTVTRDVVTPEKHCNLQLETVLQVWKAGKSPKQVSLGTADIKDVLA